MCQLLSVIVPCYNEEESLPFFYERIQQVAAQLLEKHHLKTECIFIDDGSQDQTLSLLRQFSQENPQMKYVSFSRNFGKEAAIYAGLEHSKGDFVAMLDADLQDPPELLDEMYQDITKEGYDCVATRRVTRKGEPPIRSFFARLFYRLMNKISQVDMVDGARDYRLMTRQMVDSILSLKEYSRFSKGIFGWVGYRTKWLEYKNVERVAGETKWSFWKLFKYSIDGIVAFSTFPLDIAAFIGILLCIAAFIYLIVLFVQTLAFGNPVSGYPSLMCVILFIGGIQLLTIGILGKYLAKTYLETKKRPIYIAKEVSTGQDETKNGD